MNQKILLTLFAVFLSVFCMNAQKSQTVNVVDAGTLATLLGADRTKVTDLTLTGTINDDDFATIKRMTALKSLDMLNVDLENGTIPASAFANKEFSKLILPSSLKLIGSSVFSGATIPNLDFSVCPNLEGIGVDVFSNIHLTDNILDFTSNTKLIRFYCSSSNKHGTFSNYKGHVVLPDHILNLSDGTFSYFKGTVKLPSRLKSIGSYSFKKATLPEGLDFPLTVTGFGDYAFSGAILPQGLNLPSSLMFINNRVFSEATIPNLDFSVCPDLLNLGSDVFNGAHLTDSVLDFTSNTKLTYFATGTFGNYKGHVALPDHVLNLSINMFSSFEGTVKLPSSLETLSARSFKDAILPQGLNLPSSLKVIGSDVFSGTTIPNLDFSMCPNLERLGDEIFTDIHLTDNVLDFTNNSKLKSFGQAFGTFYGYKGHVVLPDYMLSLSKKMFYGFEGTVKLPSNLEVVGSESFDGATLPEGLDFPLTVEAFGTKAFSGAILPEGLNLPSSLIDIGDYAFMGATIRNLDFSVCPNLESLGFGVFSNIHLTDNILDFTSNSKLTYFAYGTFSGYEGHVVLPDDLEVLRAGVFSSFYGVVDLPLKLKKIGSEAFLNSRIKEISLPRSVTYIGNNAFKGSYKLTKIISNNATPPALGNTVFSGVNANNCTLVVPSRSLEAYATADQWKDFINTMRSVSGLRVADLKLNEDIDQAETVISVYPNPTTDVLNVKGENVENISVYSVGGRLVKSVTKANTINLQDLASGVYIIKVTTPAGVTSEKVMKK